MKLLSQLTAILLLIALNACNNNQITFTPQWKEGVNYQYLASNFEKHTTIVRQRNNNYDINNLFSFQITKLNANTTEQNFELKILNIEKLFDFKTYKIEVDTKSPYKNEVSKIVADYIQEPIFFSIQKNNEIQLEKNIDSIILNMLQIKGTESNLSAKDQLTIQSTISKDIFTNIIRSLIEHLPENDKTAAKDWQSDNVLDGKVPLTFSTRFKINEINNQDIKIEGNLKVAHQKADTILKENFLVTHHFNGQGQVYVKLNSESKILSESIINYELNGLGILMSANKTDNDTASMVIPIKIVSYNKLQLIN